MSANEELTVTEAAAMLGTTKEKIARLIKQGVLTSRRSRLDARRRLIPLQEVKALLDEESSSPEPEAAQRRRPRTAGMYTGPVKIPSDQVEQYLRNHWHDQ